MHRRQSPDRAFGGIVVDLEEAVLEIGPQALEPAQRIADRLGQRRLARDPGELVLEPCLKIVDQTARPGSDGGRRVYPAAGRAPPARWHRAVQCA